MNEGEIIILVLGVVFVFVMTYGIYSVVNES